MGAAIDLFLDPEHNLSLPLLLLGEVLAPPDFGSINEGEPVHIFGQNSGSTNLRELTIDLDGEGAGNCQLAVNEDGQPGVWAAPGESIVVNEQTLFSGEGFSFWARGLYHPSDFEGQIAFVIRFRALST